ncbi:MAG: hypothetical protein RSA10_00305 [Bacilli bacterium]
MEERRGLDIKGFLVRLVLIIMFIFLLIWLFPVANLKPLNNQIFSDNLGRMKDVAKSYYTVERLPKEVNGKVRMSLEEMINNKLILPLTDSNGKYCSSKKSYIEVSKLQNEYVIKTYLSCTDKTDYVLEHFGCYDICSDMCKTLATTGAKTTTAYVKNTTRNDGKLYEYEFVKTKYNEVFDKYVCSNGYNVVGSSCIKEGSKTVTVNANKNIKNETSTSVINATANINDKTELVNSVCENNTVTSTINASPSSIKNTIDATRDYETETVNAIKYNVTSEKTANKITKTTNANYITSTTYDIITATKYMVGYTPWSYDYTRISTRSGLAYENEYEKQAYFDESWLELTCSTCTTTVRKYKYYHYVRKASYEYSCEKFAGYTLDGNTCKKPIVSTYCPAGFSPNGSVCSKTTVSYSCPEGYNLNGTKCTKVTTNYKCNDGYVQNGTTCSRQVPIYRCPAGYSLNGTKCVGSKTIYSCPDNTSDKTYILNGTKCSVKSTVKVCTCPSGTSPTTDENRCAKRTSSTTYSCPLEYTLNGIKCSKETITQKVSYSCDNDYILSGALCLKTINSKDTKDANKTYKIISTTSYKWSTKTNLGDGWIYTGNKRTLK